MSSAQKRSSIPVLSKKDDQPYSKLEPAKRSRVSEQYAFDNYNLVIGNGTDKSHSQFRNANETSRKNSNSSTRSTDFPCHDAAQVEAEKRVGMVSLDSRTVMAKITEGPPKYTVQGQENAVYPFSKRGHAGQQGPSVRRQEVIRKGTTSKYNKPLPSTPGNTRQHSQMECTPSVNANRKAGMPNKNIGPREDHSPSVASRDPQYGRKTSDPSAVAASRRLGSSRRLSKSHDTITANCALPDVDEEALIMSTCSDVGVEQSSGLQRNCQKFPLFLAEDTVSNFSRIGTRRSARTPSSSNGRRINVFRNKTLTTPSHIALPAPLPRNVSSSSELSKPKIGSTRLKFDTLSKPIPAQTAVFRGLHLEDNKGEDGGDKKWNRKYSLPRHHQRQRPSDRAASDTEGGSGGSQVASPEGGGDRVQGWAASFERLLEDPAGLHTFAEFLRKEYSHENIYFWTACERYRLGISSSEPSSSGGANKDQPSSGGSSPKPWCQWPGRHAAAAAIYNTHLGANAPEPVNVDSQARQVAQEGLHEPSEDLFAAAQKQVFNLMKFDSYSRFLKSALYQECVERETRGESLQFTGEGDLDPSLRIHDHSQQQTQQHLAEAAAANNNNFVKGKSELEERRRRSLLPWARHKDRSKSKDRLNSATTSDGAVSKRGGTSSISKAKGLSSSAGRLPRGSNDTSGATAPARSNSSSRTSGRHPSDSSSSLGRASEVSGSRTSLNSGSDGILLMGGRKAVSKESLTSSECLSLSGGEGGSGGITGRCRVVLPDRSQSVVAVRSGVTVERVMRRLLDRRGLPFLAFNVLHAKSDKLVAGAEDSSALCGAEVRLQRLVLFRLDLPNQKTVCVKAKPHKVASDVLRPILAKYGFKLDLMHIHTIDDPRPINVKGPITDLDGQKFIIQTKEDVKEWGVAGSGSGPCCSGSPSDADALDAITNRVFEDLLHSKTSHQLLNSCDYDARSTKTDQGSEHSGGVRGVASRHSGFSDKSGGDGGRGAMPSGAVAGSRVTSIAPSKDNDELYEGLKRAQMSRIEDQRGTKINSELPDFLKCDSENKENLVEMEGDEDLAKCFPEVANFLAGGGTASSTASAQYYGGHPPSQQHNPVQQHPHHHHYHCQSASNHHHHHHHHLHPSQQQTTPLRSEEVSQQPYLPHSSGSVAATSSSSSITTQQHSSSSLAQHQAHNFWSDISGGGSSIPSSLLATSSSSLSSSTGLPMASTSFGNFDAIDTPLAVASSLLDMHFSDTIVPKLRPRPESCVNTRSDGLTRPEQANRPKSSCGSLTAANNNHSSPDRTLMASPDLDETLSSTPQADGGEQDRYIMRGTFNGGGGDDSHRHTRAPSPSSRPHHLHHFLHHRHHHVHLHQSAAALDSIVTSSAANNPSSSATSLSHTNINYSGGNVLNFSASTNHLNSACGPRNCSSTNPLSFITRPMNTPSNYSMGGGGGSYFSTPPPPLPPKPKLGGPPRGPPPRPPSRQLPPAPPSHPPPAGDANEAPVSSAPAADSDSISFV